MDEEYVPKMKNDKQHIGIYYYPDADDNDCDMYIYEVYRKYFNKYSGYNGSQLYATPIVKLKNHPWRQVPLPKKTLIKLKLAHTENYYKCVDDTNVSNRTHLIRDLDAPLIPTAEYSYMTEALRAYSKAKFQKDPDLYKM